MNFVLNDLSVPDHAALRADIIAILSLQPCTAKNILALLPESPNKKAVATSQRLSRFLGAMANQGLVLGIRPTGGSNTWTVGQLKR